MVIYTLIISKLEIANIYQVIVGITTGIGLILWYERAKHIKGALISTLEIGAVFFTAILGFLVLREGITWMQIAGMVLLIAGVYYISKDEEPI